MIVIQPKIEDRSEKLYVGIRTQAAGDELPTVIPQLLGEVFAWLEMQGVAQAGAPFIRYHVINMAAKMDVELCVPVASAVAGDGRVCPGVLPGGRYASLVYTGARNGIQGNKVLVDWAKEQGIEWDAWDAENGHAFKGRYESFLTDPDEEPDQAKWETEVAIRLADKLPKEG
ncbi:MAG: GyrI-like domain-containing protein [Ktedonobacterales bacterium]